MSGIQEKKYYAVIGCGFWAPYQISGWQEIKNAVCLGVYDKDPGRSSLVAKKFSIPHVYPSAQSLLNDKKLDFIDIITPPETHAFYTRAAAERGLDVVCQKPMAATLSDAIDMVEVCKKNDVRLFINENFRFQEPVRKIKEILNTGILGNIFKARLSFRSAYQVYRNQPMLARSKHFIIADMGSHVLDISRFLFGEARSVFCITKKVNKQIKGEDVADICITFKNNIHCIVELSYASVLEEELFPQVLMTIECENGTLYLDKNQQIRATTNEGTTKEQIMLNRYPWSNDRYALIHSAIPCTQQDIMNGLCGGECETTGKDYLHTFRLVWSSYESARKGNNVIFG